ncbi:tumor necrosis factor alpha-induced protein 8-like protein 1 isoform X2 [Pomacea canaliculata]|uniref:tumor necrosis factor alpha-induced protein 8-like protein 1 isoform X2 n=1 Tax=Pomacea canaliculata TaxID=400727 RepID=UPI000D73C5F7|nr:tumor necrosis factor alpha-induced protein 8-like protein 1 isoform X2 [Pomacea canaliculata]
MDPYNSEERSVAEPGAGFDSRGLGLRAQKKLLGKMSSKKIAKAFIDETTGRVLDNTYRMLKEYKGHKKDAEKLMKYIIKTVVKVGILYKNDQFNAEELKMVSSFKQKFNSLTMTAISFWEVDFTYDQKFVSSGIEECRQLLQDIIHRHLTDKSKGRVDFVFNTFAEPELLNAVFAKKEGNYGPLMDAIVQDLHKLIEEGSL